MIQRAVPGRMGFPAVRSTLALLPCVVAVVVPACGPEGVGSIHADPARTSTVMVAPSRKASMPLRVKARSGRTAPHATSPKR
jgi:hypothetical protein